MSALREALTVWARQNMAVSEDGRYYATEANAVELQTYLRGLGFEGAVVTVTEGRFEVEREP